MYFEGSGFNSSTAKAKIQVNQRMTTPYYIVFKIKIFFLSVLYYNLKLRFERFFQIIHTFLSHAAAEGAPLGVELWLFKSIREKSFSRLRQK